MLPLKPDTGFLEIEVIAGFRVWQLAFMGATAIMCIIIVMCCFMRCRIPRTKQEIEADVARKKVTKQFSKHLEKIPIELMELEKVLPEVMTLEHQRILKGIKEEKMTFWQKVKKMICSGSTDDDDEDEEEDEEDDADDKKSQEGEIEDEEGKDDEDNDDKGDEDGDGDGEIDEDGDQETGRKGKEMTEKDITEATDDSCVITVVDGGPSSLKEGKSATSGKSHSGHPKRPSKNWKKIQNVTATSHAIRSSKSLQQVKVDSPKTSAHKQLQEVIVDLKSKSDHGHSKDHGHSTTKSTGESGGRKSRPPTRPPSQDHDEHEQATRL